MPKITPIQPKEDGGVLLDDAKESLWLQNRYWVSVEYLECINLLDKNEISRLKTGKVEYLLTGILHQKYLRKDGKINHIKTTVNLLSDNFDVTKDKKVSIKKINGNYEELLFHIYSEGLTSPHPSETLRFVTDSDFLNINPQTIEKSLLLLLI